MLRILNIAFAFSLFVSNAALAGESATDFSKQIHTLDGTPMNTCADQQGEKCNRYEPLTVGTVSISALGQAAERGATYPDMIGRELLSQKIYATKEPIELTGDQKALLKKQIMALPNVTPRVLFQAMEAIDPASVKQ